jgi:hypothetical protein
MDVLRETGADVSELEPIREDLRRNIKAYLEYAAKMKGAKG